MVETRFEGPRAPVIGLRGVLMRHHAPTSQRAADMASTHDVSDFFAKTRRSGVSRSCSFESLDPGNSRAE